MGLVFTSPGQVQASWPDASAVGTGTESGTSHGTASQPLTKQRWVCASGLPVALTLISGDEK